MHGFPVVGGHHLDRIPGAAVEKGAVRAFAGALLATDAKIRVHFDTAEGWVVFVRHPEHACFDRTVFNASRRAGAAGATVRSDGQNARSLFARRFAIAL